MIYWIVLVHVWFKYSFIHNCACYSIYLFEWHYSLGHMGYIQLVWLTFCREQISTHAHLFTSHLSYIRHHYSICARFFLFIRRAHETNEIRETKQHTTLTIMLTLFMELTFPLQYFASSLTQVLLETLTNTNITYHVWLYIRLFWKKFFANKQAENTLLWVEKQNKNVCTHAHMCVCVFVCVWTALVVVYRVRTVRIRRNPS